ncbi:SDR family NAD(P)-dependent oxidoreductase [Paenibacillus sp. TC-CSREp1]|uniref:SDR family NAD(P)-dependent oxidoreductase n=1 Tax=Paenibacillus sp. TC-CSREp1 TaxID=3410089 RepID=UPI003CF72432
MKTIAIVGAGPGLGLSLAKKFGANQFAVALISRNASKLDAMVQELTELKIQARSYVADLNDPSQLKKALRSIKENFGSIDVLEFSPFSPSQTFTSVLETTPESVMAQVNGYLLPAILSVNEALPQMQQNRDGAILFTTGISSITPIPFLGNVGIVMSGTRNYATNLHTALKDQGIYIGHLSIGVPIQTGTESDPDLIADAWYELLQQKEFESTFPKELKELKAF